MKEKLKEILIDPITRLEGHGNVSIFLNDKGEVENAYIKIPELRGFEKFCIGRNAELMPNPYHPNMRCLSSCSPLCSR